MRPRSSRALTLASARWRCVPIQPDLNAAPRTAPRWPCLVASAASCHRYALALLPQALVAEQRRCPLPGGRRSSGCRCDRHRLFGNCFARASARGSVRSLRASAPDAATPLAIAASASLLLVARFWPPGGGAALYNLGQRDRVFRGGGGGGQRGRERLRSTSRHDRCGSRRCRWRRRNDRGCVGTGFASAMTGPSAFTLARPACCQRGHGRR